MSTTEKQKEYLKLRRRKFKENGLCIVCGKHQPLDGKVKCEKCNNKAVETQRAYYKRIRAEYYALKQMAKENKK